LPTSSDSELAIRVDHVGKRYQIGTRQTRYPTLREALATRARGVAWRLTHPHVEARRANDTFWALEDVSLSVPKGRAVGIIGHNGSGKSTLLKILSRVTPPTVGRVEIRGRVGTLLEVGTGFHNELTGRENIYLSGAILGLSRSHITRRFDDIVDFAGVSRFIDTPVKWYSSGMYLRLAFAVAAHLEPHVLIVDEVLAVGDVAFQRKCLGRMSDVTGQGRTVLFVSHDLDAVRRLCADCVLLDGGRIAAQGPSDQIVQQYLSTAAAAVASTDWIDLTARRRTGTGEARFVAAKVSTGRSDNVRPFPGGPLELLLVIESDAPRRIGSMAVSIEMLSGLKLIEADILMLGEELRLSAGANDIRFRIPELHLNPGLYSVRLWLGHTSRSGFDHIPGAFEIEVVRSTNADSAAHPPSSGAVACRFEVHQH
jgi:lipopolysaccharide transport system ATP-binding protein